MRPNILNAAAAGVVIRLVDVLDVGDVSDRLKLESNLVHLLASRQVL